MIVGGLENRTMDLFPIKVPSARKRLVSDAIFQEGTKTRRRRREMVRSSSGSLGNSIAIRLHTHEHRPPILHLLLIQHQSEAASFGATTRTRSHTLGFCQY